MTPTHRDQHRPVVLVVEDEPLVRMLGADILEDAGFGVVEAVDGDAALRILEQGTDIDVLFTDIQMPGSLDGFALARVVHERWPAIRLVLTSGQARPERSELPDDGRFLPKPTQPEELVRVIQAAVASPH